MSSPRSVNPLLLILEQLEGPEATHVVEILMTGDSFTDDEIARQLELPIKEVRKALYRLHASNLARFQRTRDAETGYFEFHWMVARKRLKDLILRKRQHIVQLLKQRLSFESKQLLYGCGKIECTPLSFERAYEAGFICPKCQEPLTQVDNKDLIAFLEAKIAELTEHLHDGLDKLL